MKADRLQRVSLLIRQYVSQLLQHYVADREIGLITVTKVDVTSDLKQAWVHISVLDKTIQHRKVLKVIKQVQHQIQQDLNHQMAIKTVPRLQYRIDEQIAAESRIDELLAQDPLAKQRRDA